MKTIGKIIEHATDLACAFCFTLAVIAISLLIVINFKPLYYHDIDALDIEDQSGFDKNTIIENYDVLIEYCSPSFKGELQFPTLTSSASGLKHFSEVKVVFNTIYLIGVIAFISLFVIAAHKVILKHYSFIIVSGVGGLVIPAFFALFAAINFDKLFIRFHEIVFQNDDWLFKASEDPVITILPEAFFMHCLIAIIVLVILFSVLTIVGYVVGKRVLSKHLEDK